jgi:hypothetical protein
VDGSEESGSDSETDEDLNADIEDEINELSKRKKTPEIQTRIIALQKLLRGEIQSSGPKPPVPDY